MKAGSAGSNPDGAANIRQNTQPLRYFLKEVGESVASLNTAVVGLDAVENGYKKPDTLNISWNPTDRKASARKARKFLLEAILVRVSESLSQYISAVSKLTSLEFSKKKNHKESTLSNAEKLAEIAISLRQEDSFLLAGGCLLIHWRNRVVHRNSTAKLTDKQKKALQSSSSEINDQFASLSVERLLVDFENGAPTLKDITSLIAMTIKLARRLDAEIGNLTKSDLDVLLAHYGLDAKITKLELETSPKKREDSILRLLKSSAPGLILPYKKHFIN